jgi:hypothetical protein
VAVAGLYSYFICLISAIPYQVYTLSLFPFVVVVVVGGGCDVGWCSLDIYFICLISAIPYQVGTQYAASHYQFLSRPPSLYILFTLYLFTHFFMH